MMKTVKILKISKLKCSETDPSNGESIILNDHLPARSDNLIVLFPRLNTLYHAVVHTFKGCVGVFAGSGHLWLDLQVLLVHCNRLTAGKYINLNVVGKWINW